MSKKFAVQLYIKNNKVSVKKDSDALTAEEIKACVSLLGDSGADELIVHMDCVSDEECDNAIKELKNIANISEIPVTALYPIKRAEDVKKLLYANAKRVILNVSKESNWDMLEEVSNRFGKEKICVTLEDYTNISIYHKACENFASAIYVFGGIKPSELANSTSLVCMVSLPDVMPEKLLEIMSEDNVEGIFGAVVDGNVKEINALKSLCLDRGIEVKALIPQIKWSELKLNESGLIPVIAQDYKTNEVLMMAYMNEEAYNQTLKSGKMNYYSRSRKSQWEKGESSGHTQYVKALYADCDKDTLLAKVSQIGVACHTGSYSCFFNEIASKEYEEKNPLKVFESVYSVIEDRKENPKEGSYTNYLFDKGVDKILKKLGEEATEIVIAAKNPDNTEIKYEISDFLYHAMVLMVEKGVTWEEICVELSRR